MLTDLNGLRLTAPDASMVEAFDQAVDRLLHFDYGMADPLRPVLAGNVFFPLAEIFNAYLGGLSTEAQLAAKAAGHLAAFGRRYEDRALNEREHGHLSAATLLLDGSLASASEVLAQITAAYPLDVLALAVGHQVDLLLGDSRRLHDRVRAALPCWHQSQPRYASVLGMYAFGLEENGQCQRAQELGTRAADLDPANVWAVHAVAHTFEMRSLCSQGIEWLGSRRDCWATKNQLHAHLAWHYCLHLIERGDIGQVLTIYDDVMAAGRTESAAIKLLNGSSLLWRLMLLGVDVKERATALAQEWASLTGGAWCAFNDIHAVMCYLGAEDLLAARALIADRRRYLAHCRARAGNAARADNASVTAEVGLPVCRALLAFRRGRYADTLRLIYPVRDLIYRCGGSHAQRDVIHQTMIEAAVRCGREEDARMLARERAAIRDGSPADWRRPGDTGTGGSMASQAGARGTRRPAQPADQVPSQDQ
jgi:hypothetical protein